MANHTDPMSQGIPLKCNLTGNHDFIFTLIPIVYSCNFVVGVLGNSLVVAVIYYYMKLKTVANIFVLNLAVSDLTFLITLPMWATSTASGYHWPFSDFLCKASAGLILLNLYTSIFFLTALSVDRYLAIVHPVQSRRCRTLAYARLICVLVWVLAFLLSMPTALTRSTVPIQGANITVCGNLNLKNNTSQVNKVMVVSSLTKCVFGFLVPLIIILTCYSLIGRALLKARKIQKSTRSHGDEVLSMLVSVVVCFFLCWAPHQVFNFLDVLMLLKVIEDKCHMLEVIDTAMPFTICIAFFNSCMNPILYSFVGRNFRRNLLRLLRCSAPIPPASHASLSTKMSALSYRASESPHLTAGKPISLSRTIQTSLQ